MKTVKMSLTDLQGKMNRKEMKNIMAGCLENICFHEGMICPKGSGWYGTCHYVGGITNWVCQ